MLIPLIDKYRNQNYTGHRRHAQHHPHRWHHNILHQQHSTATLLILFTYLISDVFCEIHKLVDKQVEQFSQPSGNSNDLLQQLKVPQCREQCIDQFNCIDELTCSRSIRCSLCDYPRYKFNRFSDAIDLLCWNSCSTAMHLPLAPTSHIQSSNQFDRTDNMGIKSVANSTTISTKFNVIHLTVQSIVRDGSLASAYITWTDIELSQCLVTWEVSGGGLMGNLLTDTPFVQLSLWPDTLYRIQVTCKSKVAGHMFKSQPLLLNTSTATVMSTTTTKVTTTTMPTKSSTSQTSKLVTVSTANQTQLTSKTQQTNVELSTLSTVDIPINGSTIPSKQHQDQTTTETPAHIKVILVERQQQDTIMTTTTRTPMKWWPKSIKQIQLIVITSFIVLVIGIIILVIKHRYRKRQHTVKLNAIDVLLDKTKLISRNRNVHETMDCCSVGSDCDVGFFAATNPLSPSESIQTIQVVVND